MPSLYQTLKTETRAEVLNHPFDLGRYAHDASIYQVTPRLVVIPKTWEDVTTTLAIAKEHHCPITPRGAATSLSGQTVNTGIILDFRAHLNRIIARGEDAVTVEPGLVLATLNAELQKTGQWFPVDISTASRATIGGMVGNNSSGSRSLKYGMMRANVAAIDAVTADGQILRFEPTSKQAASQTPAFETLLALGEAAADDIRATRPNTKRQCAGYNLDCLLPEHDTHPLHHLLIGSEGTLALSQYITLPLQPLPKHRILFALLYDDFFEAMASVQHLTTLAPSAVELMDVDMISLSLDHPEFQTTAHRLTEGRKPNTILAVEFECEAPQDAANIHERLAALIKERHIPTIINPIFDPAEQQAVWHMRTHGLNILMSIRSEKKAIAFIEDATVPVEYLEAYCRDLDALFTKHGIRALFYGHASVGTLHVRPVLNLKEAPDITIMRDIAETVAETVKQYNGTHSGEHGDGIIRGHFHERVLGKNMVAHFQRVKDCLDVDGLLNPNRLINPPAFDEPTSFRYKPKHKAIAIQPKLAEVFQWGEGGAFAAVEMCNSNGACLKKTEGGMCPSYRALGEERASVRGRATTLRLALSGQLGEDALTSPAMHDTLKYCVSCKACKRECPMQVDMAKLKIEVLAARPNKPWREALLAHFPTYARFASRAPSIANMFGGQNAIARKVREALGYHADINLPAWRTPFTPGNHTIANPSAPPVWLFADSFNRYFEPDNLYAAIRVLNAAGSSVFCFDKPLCCGRTQLACGRTDLAIQNLSACHDAFKTARDAGGYVVGLEPSCMMTFRDEAPAMLPNWDEKTSEATLLFEEFLTQHSDLTRLKNALSKEKTRDTQTLHYHTHCHQKAFDAAKSVGELLSMLPNTEARAIDSGCCGMAGAFGYGRDTYDVSKKMAELALLPAVRKAKAEGDSVVACGTSCRHQIAHHGHMAAHHPARIFAEYLA